MIETSANSAKRSSGKALPRANAPGQEPEAPMQASQSELVSAIIYWGERGRGHIPGQCLSAQARQLAQALGQMWFRGAQCVSLNAEQSRLVRLANPGP